MGLVSKNIPNLINGVSQQPPSLRLESQGEVQENGFSDVVDGLKKRPPTKFLKSLMKTSASWQATFNLGNNSEPLTELELSEAFFHTYKVSDSKQFQIVITPDKVIRVYDIHGNLRYESGSASWLADGTHLQGNSDDTSYLPDHYADITATSVADATFIVNKNKTVEMSDAIIPANTSSQALVYLKSVNYGKDYTLTMQGEGTDANDFTAEASTPNQITTTANNEDEFNSDGIKVSHVIGETIANSTRTNLRTEVLSQLGDLVHRETYLYEKTYESNSDDYNLPDSIRDLAEPTQSVVIGGVQQQALNVNTWVNADPTTRPAVIIKVGDSHVPYDATGVNGWLVSPDDDTKIRLPAYLFPLRSRAVSPRVTKYFYERPSTTIDIIENGADGFIEPVTYNDEPYFVITCPEGSSFGDFNIIATDDDGGVNLKAFKGTAKSFTDLPNQCIEGMRLGVVGDNQKKEDDFHVVFEGAAGSGFWRETVAPNLFNYFDLSTMPHTLRQLEGGAFKFSQAKDNFENTWAHRKAGDDNTNPAPSFVGQKISDIFFHRNRLGVLAGENVIFSEAGGYLNFWRTTVRTLLDSDPIDVSVSQNEVANLEAAVPIQDNLLLFSNLNQFTLSATQLLTPAEVTIDQSTKYECDLTATPVGAGTSVFFATKSGSFSGVREYFTRDDTEIRDATEITAHVPKYLDGTINKMIASSNESMLVCLTEANKSECYVYKWYNSSQERLQSSWSKWKFDRDIVDVAFNNAKLYFTFVDGSYEEMDLTDQGSPLLIDHQLTLSANSTSSEVPDDFNTAGMVAITDEGVELGLFDDVYVGIDNPIIEHLNNGGSVTIGYPYTFKYVMSEQVFKPVQGDSTQMGRFQLRKMSFNYSDTGRFDVTVKSVGRDAVLSTFTGRILGQAQNLLSQPAVVDSGSFEVGIQSQASTTEITITNDTHLPSVFQSAEWEGFVVLRNKRL